MKLTLEMAQDMMKRSGSSLCLGGTGITALPENLTVNGSLYLSGTRIVNPKVKRLRNGDYVEGRYLYADGILTHIKKAKKFKGYTFFVGKIPGKTLCSMEQIMRIAIIGLMENATCCLKQQKTVGQTNIMIFALIRFCHTTRWSRCTVLLLVPASKERRRSWIIWETSARAVIRSAKQSN